MKKYLSLLIPLTFFVTSAVLLTCNGCTPEPAAYKFDRAESCFRTQSKEFCTVINESLDGEPQQCWKQHCALPHRPINELTNWGQGRNPGPNECPPGTVAFYVEDLFLECYR